MTHEEATTQAAERQRLDSAGKWMAVQREAEWVVMRISVPVDTTRATGITVPPRVLPHEPPVSELETIARKYGAAG